jgi:hypothetical protein
MVVGGRLVVVVVLGGTVVGGVLIGAVVDVVGGGCVVVVVGGFRCVGTVVVVVGGFRCDVVDVVVRIVVVVVVGPGARRCVPGWADDGPVPPGSDVCLFGWGWETVDAPTVFTGWRLEEPSAAVFDWCDPVELVASANRSAVPEPMTGTPAPVVRFGISGRVAPT